MKKFRTILCFALCAALILPVFAESKLLPVYCVKRDARKVSLSIDAAWGNEDTRQLIDILDKYGVKVTFFVVGDWARKYPESVKALCDAGHEVMNHSDTHPHMNSLSVEQIKNEIENCNKAIEEVTGVCPTLIRLPYGEYDNKVIQTVNDMGMTAVQWDVDSLDWKDLSARQIYERVTTRVHQGSIVLFHNAAKHTPAALEDILKWLKDNDYEAVPISQLLLDGNTTLDHEGRQHRA